MENCQYNISQYAYFYGKLNDSISLVLSMANLISKDDNNNSLINNYI